MADNRLRLGFQWSRARNSGPPPIMRARVATGYDGQNGNSDSVDMYPGDPINFVDAGHAALSAAGATIAGIMMGVEQYWDGSALRSGKALPNQTAYGTILQRQSVILYTPADAGYWEVCCDDATTATTEAAYLALIQSNADHILTDGYEPRSGALLDISTNTDASPGSAQWRIEDIAPSEENVDFSGNYVRLIVSVNECQTAPHNTTGL